MRIKSLFSILEASGRLPQTITIIVEVEDGAKQAKEKHNMVAGQPSSTQRGRLSTSAISVAGSSSRV